MLAKPLVQARWRLALVAAPLAALALLAHPDRGSRSEAPAPAVPRERTPLFADTKPAHNPTQLVVLVDPGRVIGWIGGTESFAGKTAEVKIDEKTHAASVGDDNTFVIPCRVDKETVATVSVGKLAQRVALRPAEKLSPCAFFIVDRPVYRPDQAVQFAAYLREPDERGDLRPVAGRAVEVHLTSVQKKTTAAKIKLTSDESGRIAGRYVFVDADQRDDYELSVPGFKGTARLALAEFRKSKIKLAITGQREGDKVRLRFAALDFLDKPIASSKVQFTSQVVRNPAREAPGSLRPEQFAYAPVKAAQIAPVLEDLPEDERLLVQASHWPTTLASAGPHVVAQEQGEVKLDGAQAGETVVKLPRNWKQGRHAVLVEGVLVDANGREQRATQVIPLAHADERLQLSISKARFAVDEPVYVTARLGEGVTWKAATLVAQRLTPAPQGGLGYNPYFIGNAINSFDLQSSAAGVWTQNAYWPGARRWRRLRPAIEAEEPVRRTLSTATAFDGDTAELRLSEPGAYKLVAMGRTADGKELRQEIGCLVHGEEGRPALVLELDRTTLDQGERLQGTLHSGWSDARVLLTVRDGAGYRLWKPLQLRKGVVPLDEALPQACRYGCVVEVQYADDQTASEPAQVVSQLIHVRPTQRELHVEARGPSQVGPGENVTLDLQVDRKEAVDLVVSVYDQSLLGIKPDRSTDPRSFFWADDRIRQAQAREVLRRKLAGVTLGQLLDRARAASKKSRADTDPEYSLLATLASRADNGHLYSNDISGLLHLAGVPVHTPWGLFGAQWLKLTPALRDTPLADLLERPTEGWHRHYAFLGDVLFLTERHESWPAEHIPYGYAQVQNAGPGYNARGDAHFSASANSMFSASAQSMFSHGPTGAAPAAVLDASADQPGLAVRRDFSDSAFWSALVRTDVQGKARVSFKVPDSLTNWQVVVTALSKDLHVGRAVTKFQTYKPVMIWPMLPQVFTCGDRIDVFASVHNRTDAEQELRVRLKAENGEVLTQAERHITLKPHTNAPVYWTFRPGSAGFTQLLMSAECAAGSDASLKRLPVLRAAAEQVVTASGFCKGTAVVKLPADIDPATASLEVRLAPSLAADLADTLDYLVDYPYGCAEQTMSRFFPAVQVAQVLKRYQIANEALHRKLPGCVQGGIKRLLELQQPDGGWGWNGNGQTHEMITPYVLYGLIQAEKSGHPTGNDQAIARGLVRLRQFIDAMGPAQAADRIYCLYVYGLKNDMLTEWWQFIEQQQAGGKLSDAALALALEMAVRAGKKGLADKLTADLHKRAITDEGMARWSTAGFSRWANDQFEVTAQVLQALVAHDKDDPLVPGALAFFAATKRGNRWNSTRDTALIVCALCEYLSRQEVGPQAARTVAFRVNDGDERTTTLDGKALTRSVVIPAAQLKKGANRIAFTEPAKGMMYRVVLRYAREGRDLAPAGHGMRVTRQFWLLDANGRRGREVKSGDAVPRGSYIECGVQVEHVLGLPMTFVLVECPRPSACEVLPVDDRRFEQASTPYVLREERVGHVAYHHEATPPVVTDRCVLHAEMPGELVVPPARAELMYQTEMTGHSGTFVLRVKEEEDR